MKFQFLCLLKLSQLNNNQIMQSNVHSCMFMVKTWVLVNQSINIVEHIIGKNIHMNL
jgi:hypothetical protein